MFEPLNVGEKVLIFYHPLGLDDDKYDIGYQSVGVVIAREKMSDEKYWYKVEANNTIYTGLHCVISSDNYFFAREKEYICYLRNVIAELNLEKERIDIKKKKCRELIDEMKGKSKIKKI